MKFILLTLSSILISFSLDAQKITLTKGKKTKRINSDQLFEMAFVNGEKANTKHCDQIVLLGLIEKITEDSIWTISNVVNIYDCQEVSKKQLTHTFKEYSYQKKFAKKDCIYISPRKSCSAMKKNGTIRTTAGILSLTGILTFAHSFFVDDKENREKIWLISSIELGVGIIAGLLVKKRDYYFKFQENPWQFE